MKLVNLCKHPIVLCTFGVYRTIPTSGSEARVASEPAKEESWNVEDPLGGDPFTLLIQDASPHWGDVLGLPESPAEDTMYIVSLPCAQAIAAEAARLEGELKAVEGDPLCTVADEMHRRLAVLRACVRPGTGPMDRQVLWTEEDHEQGRCDAASIGRTRAVRKLIRAI